MTNPTANHPLDDLAAYAVDALDDAERAAVDDHLAGCLACRAELVGHLEALASLTSDEEPPPTVWQRIAADIGAPDLPLPAPPPAAAGLGAPAFGGGSAGGGDDAGGSVTEMAGRPVLAGRASRIRPAAVAALAAAAAVLVAFGFVLGGPGGDSGPDNVGELAQQALDEPGAEVGMLDDLSGEPVARVVADDGSSYVLLDELDALPAGRAYQLWSLDGPQPVSLGLLGDGSAEAVALPLPATATELAISDEPAGGVTAPTGPVVASGSIARS